MSARLYGQLVRKLSRFQMDAKPQNAFCKWSLTLKLCLVFVVYDNFSGRSANNLIPQNAIYLAEARSRVLFLDLQLGQNLPSMQSMTSSLPSQFGENGGLRRFPSNYRISPARLVEAASRSSLISSNSAENLSASYSAKAMELSLFGSKVKMLCSCLVICLRSIPES